MGVGSEGNSEHEVVLGIENESGCGRQTEQQSKGT